MGLSNFEKQDKTLLSFEKTNKSENRRTEPTFIEAAIAESRIRLDREAKNRKEEVRISLFNPNNPINGSMKWNKRERQEFKESTIGKELKKKK